MQFKPNFIYTPSKRWELRKRSRSLMRMRKTDRRTIESCAEETGYQPTQDCDRFGGMSKASRIKEVEKKETLEYLIAKL